MNPKLPESQVADDRLVWFYLGCERGMDCSGDSEWFFQACLYEPGGCAPGESGLDLLHRWAAARDVYDLEQRADRLGAKVDAQAWVELGLVE